MLCLLAVIQDHPRIRGEHPCLRALTIATLGSSPHTRGAPQGRQIAHDQQRIIPAYAGSTVEPSEMLTAQKDHPRIRGEHVAPQYHKGRHAGSSPHTRGAHLAGGGGGVDVGIIPAYAGSTRSCSGLTCSTGDHPRIRGEHSLDYEHGVGTVGSSPHTRGAQGSNATTKLGSGIIPAYAGSTGVWRSSRRGPGDHPRIRGEHRARPAPRSPARGSSPHTRGAPGPLMIRPRRPGDHPRIRGEH